MLTAPSQRPPHRLVRHATGWLALHAALLLAPGTPLHAQAAGLRPPQEVSDSSAVIEEARRAQRRFEGVRRAALRVTDRQAGSPCEVRLGRYCYWYDSAARPPVPREAENVTMARRRLLQVLDSLGTLSPADAWIVGQRVRYRVDALDSAGAVAVATSGCSTPGWWCDALRGYALHIAGRHAAAAHAFDAALSAMPGEDRCGWENPAVVLDRAERDRVQRMSCAARREVANRLWWLGDPQLAQPGNELRTEFLARRTASVLEADARFIYGARWSWDTDELLIRYGWPTWWTRERSPQTGGASEILLVGHEPVPAFNFLPVTRAVLGPPGAMRNDHWSPAQQAPPMRYATSSVTWWRDASAQVARMQRGGTTLVVAAFEAPDDTMLRDAEATLVLSAGPQAPAHASAAVRGTRGVAQARMPRHAPGTELLASLEVRDASRRAMARHRLSVIEAPAGRLALSDIVLHRPLDAPPVSTTLDSIIGRILPSIIIAGDRVGVFWETYGVAAGGEMLDVALTIERMDAPWLRRAAARLRMADPITPVQIRWKAAPPMSGEAAAQTVSVNVANLARGEYRLRIRVEGSDGAHATAERGVRIAGR